MKKVFLFILLSLANVAFAADVIETKVNINELSKTGFVFKKHWALNPWHDLSYYIENPTHVTLHFEIEISPTAKDGMGFPVPSAPIKLTCGDQQFFITEYSPQGIVVCKTKDNIQLDLIHLEAGSHPSEGEYTLEFK